MARRLVNGACASSTVLRFGTAGRARQRGTEPSQVVQASDNISGLADHLKAPDAGGHAVVWAGIRRTRSTRRDSGAITILGLHDLVAAVVSRRVNTSDPRTEIGMHAVERGHT